MNRTVCSVAFVDLCVNSNYCYRTSLLKLLFRGLAHLNFVLLLRIMHPKSRCLCDND